MSLLPFQRKNPFFRLLLAYAAGVLAACPIEPPGWADTGLILVILLMTVIMAIALWLSSRSGAKHVFGMLLFMVLFASGLLQGILESHVQELAGRRYMKKGIFQAVLLEQPDIRSRTVKAMVRVDGEIRGDSLLSGSCKALLYFERDSVSESLGPGTEILFMGEMRRIWLAGNPGEFDYRQYLANRRVYLQAYLATGTYRTGETGSKAGIRALAARTRQVMLDSYRQLHLNDTEFGVLSALTLGYRDDLDARTKNAFVHAGVMHIMALSGFHVGVVALMLGFVFSPFRGTATGKWTRVFMTWVFLWAFAFISGLSTSVIRATLMFSLALPGRLFGRKVNAWNMLFASTLLILTARPGFMADTGFQLSFLAVAGISLVHPVLQKIPKHAFLPLKSLGKIFVVSFAAQLATLPVTLRCFHQFPVYFWLANLFVIPVAALVMYAGIGYLVIGFVKPLAFLTGKVVAWSVKGLVMGVSMVERLPYALCEGIDISVAQSFLLLFVLLSFGLFVLHRKNGLFLTGLAAFLLFLVAGTWRDWQQCRQKVLSVHNVSGLTCINLISGRTGCLLARPSSLVTHTQLDYSFGSYWTHRGVYRHVTVVDPDEEGKEPVKVSGFTSLYFRNQFMGNNLFLQFHDKTLVVLKDALAEGPVSAGPLDVDLLVVTGSMPYYPDMILRYFRFRMLILDSSMGYYDALRWTEWCRDSDVQYWNVAEQGAFLLEAR